ncbi:MAG: hypothetical protein PHF86_13390 [Candidatus Nanoarchaeia archaeon]|nr:hypothetical protein [Candidatus Nanoarchaeia archaeon]
MTNLEEKIVKNIKPKEYKPEVYEQISIHSGLPYNKVKEIIERVLKY